MNKIIGFDIDGVLTVPEQHLWEEDLCSYFQLEPQPNPEMGDILGRYQLTREQIREFFAARSHFIFPKLIMREGANVFLQELKALGFTIILVTARTDSPETPKWLARNRIPYDLLVHEHDKLEPCLRHGLRLFVEDNYENAKAVSTAIPVLLMDTVYNRLADLPNVHRVYNYNEIRDFVLPFFTRQVS